MTNINDKVTMHTKKILPSVFNQMLIACVVVFKNCLISEILMCTAFGLGLEKDVTE